MRPALMEAVGRNVVEKVVENVVPEECSLKMQLWIDEQRYPARALDKLYTNLSASC